MNDPDDVNGAERLGALFRAAAADPPPTSFDHRDVHAASRRITARRRTALITSGVVVAAVFGFGAAVVLPDYSPPTTTAAPALGEAPVAGEAPTSGEAPGSAAAPESGRAMDAPALPDVPGGPPPADSELPEALRGGRAVPAPLGPGSTVCADRQDPALRALLEQVLPEVTGMPSVASPDVCLPGEHRYLSLEVDDDGTTGVLTVAYLPPGATVALSRGAISAPSASGGTVILGATPVEAPPFAGRLDTTLAFLATRL